MQTILVTGFRWGLLISLTLILIVLPAGSKSASSDPGAAVDAVPTGIGILERVAATSGSAAPTGHGEVMSSVPAKAAEYPCAPLDIVFILDETGSMNDAIANVKSQVAALTEEIDRVSAGDYRIGLVAFNDHDVEVLSGFKTKNAKQIRRLVNGLSDGGFGGGSGGSPEAWDEALVTVVDNRSADEAAADSSMSDPQAGDFTVPWRDEAEKMIVLVTDAQAGGFDQDNDNDSSDADRAYAAAVRASTTDIRIATVFVPNGNHQEDAPTELQQVSNLTASTYFATQADASNLSDGLTLNVTTCAADSDGDGLFDIWETDGYDANGDGKIDVKLPAMGAKPDHKDLFLQINWMSPEFDASCHTDIIAWCAASNEFPHSPDPNALKRLVDAFASAPVTNPDGQSGIRVHVDAGDLSPSKSGIKPKHRKGGPRPEHEYYLSPKHIDDGDLATKINEMKARALPAARSALFTWAMYVHSIAQPAGPTIKNDRGLLGYAPGLPGDTVLIAGAQTSTSMEASTLVHELGHTLGLRHGGLDHVQGKPNYLSLMNYDMAFAGGLTRNGQGGILDYSRFSLNPLDERSLDEASGLSGTHASELSGYETYYRCTGDDPAGDEPIVARTITAEGPIDWDCNGTDTDSDVSGSIHNVRKTHSDYDSLLELTTRNDWETLTFTGGSRGGLESPAFEDAEDEDFTFENWRNTPKDYAIAVSGPGSLTTSSDSKLARLGFLLENIGTQDDTYQIAVEAAGDWESVATTPERITVSAGETVTVPVDVPVSAGASKGDTLTVQFSTQSTNADWVSANTVATLTIGKSIELSPAGSLTIDPVDPRAGSDFTVTGDGFAPGGDAIVASEKDWFEPVSVKADEAGRVTTTVRAPSEAGTGKVSIIGAAPADATVAQSDDTSDPDAGENPTSKDEDDSDPSDPLADAVPDTKPVEPAPPRLLASSVTVTGFDLRWIVAAVAAALALIIGVSIFIIARSRHHKEVI